MPLEKQEKIETVEDKQNRLDIKNLSEDERRSFNDLASELGKPKDNSEKYSGEDIKEAASKRINSMIETSGKKLSEDESKELNLIKEELLKDMGGKDPKEAMEEYGKLRDKLTGIIAAGEGKGKMNADSFQKSQEQQANNQKENADAFDKLQKFIKEITETQSSQKEKVNLQKKTAEREGDKTQGIMNPEVASAASLDLNQNWP